MPVNGVLSNQLQSLAEENAALRRRVSELEAAANKPLKAPFPYFGGKAPVAAAVWERFGQVKNYVEPFCGSAAMLLARPLDFDCTETINDADAFVANFWRGVQHAPLEVAEYADWPVNEDDLHARNIWLVSRKEPLRERIIGDPEWYDAKIAGWWAWGKSTAIGGTWCSKTGPWTSRDGLLVRGEPGSGVARSKPHVSDRGKGVHRKSIGDLREYLAILASRLRKVRVLGGDWARACTRCATTKHGLTAVFLDPPYDVASGRDMRLYACDSGTVAKDCREWAIAHGGDPQFRIALCCYDDTTMPDDWTMFRWKANGGYGNGAKKTTRGKENCKREVIWFSPHCLKVPQ